MARVFQLDRNLVRKIEGQISETRERARVSGGPVVGQRPIDFVADTAGVSRSTVQRWLRDARRAERSNGRRPRERLLRDFLNSFDALCRASVDPIERAVIGIAANPKHPRCVDAAKFMLPRLDPIGEPSEASEAHRSIAPTMGDVPQAVFDDLTEPELARLDQISEALAALERESLAILRASATRVGVGLDAIDRLQSAAAGG